MLNWFWRSSSYPQSRAESPVLLYRTNTYLHMKVIKPLFCLEEGCVPFTAGTSSIFPSVILLLSCLLSSNVLSKSASQVSVFCKSSGLGVAQYPELFIVWFIFIYTSWSCAPSTCCTLLDFCHTLFETGSIRSSFSLQCFSTVVWPRFKVSGLCQNTINNKNTRQVCMKFKIKFLYITMLSFQCYFVPPIFLFMNS